MLKYVGQKLLYAIFTIWIIMTATFFLMNTLPGDPVQAGPKILPEAVAKNLEQRWGLDKPLGERYVIYLKNFLKGDFGESYLNVGLSANKVISDRLPASIQLGLQAVGVGLILGLILGIAAAFHRNTWLDSLTMFIAIIGVSVPSFVFASLLQRFAGGGFFATIGWAKPSDGLMELFQKTFLPTMAAAIGSIATYSRFMRSSVLDTLGNDYILTAKAKGLSRGEIIRRHVLRNSLTPIISIVAPQLAGIFTGSFVIEKIFTIPGLGRYYVDSVNGRDYPLIMSTTVFFAIIFILSIVLMDILYALVDPRIRKSLTEKQ